MGGLPNPIHIKRVTKGERTSSGLTEALSAKYYRERDDVDEVLVLQDGRVSRQVACNMEVAMGGLSPF